VQLLSSRLQLQEGRINGMIRRLDTVRDSLASGRRELDQLKAAQKFMEGADEPRNPGEPKEDFGHVLVGVKGQVAAAQADVTRLAAEETQLTQDLAIEQARWTEISQRLDELERALAKR
jgi:DNA repair exonuclease SbcCD ATPase subunit